MGVLAVLGRGYELMSLQMTKSGGNEREGQ